MRTSIARLSLLFFAFVTACAHGPSPEGLRVLPHNQGRLIDAGLTHAARNSCVPLTWTNATFESRFEGPELSLQLGCSASVSQAALGHAAQDVADACRTALAVSLDGQPLPDVVVRGGPMSTHRFLADAGKGPHTLTLVRRTEAQMGQVTLCDVAAPGGRLLPPAPPARRQMLILGDSISAGYGNLCGKAQDKEPLQKQDGLRTYGALAAAHLGADARIMAWSGIGLWRNGDGSTACTLPKRWRARPNRDEPGALDAVVVNLGTNDYRRPADDEAFVRTYLGFVHELADAYPAAHLFLAVGPMFPNEPGARRPTHRSMAALVQQVHRALKHGGLGDRVHVLEMTPQTGIMGFGCDYHPNLWTHRQMAQSLVHALAQTLGWTPF